MTSFAAERPTFFEGQYLGAEDLTALVTYFRTLDARQIIGQHTWGIAVGLDLAEVTAPDDTLEVYLQPGLAFDGYGRVIAVLNRTRLDPALFQSGAFVGEVEVWIRYDQQASQGLRKGFEVCAAQDSFSRVSETFAIEVGPRNSILDRQGGVVVNGEAVVDAREALRQVNDQAPLICDGSIGHQDLPLDQEDARWLIPLGLVHRLAGSPGAFQSLTAGGRVRSRLKRRYAGVVAESLFATDGVIRLRHRHTAFDAAKTTDALCGAAQAQPKDLFYCASGGLSARELVWMEGHVRVTGDTRLFGGRLEFRDTDGRDYVSRTIEGTALAAGTPLLLQRKDVNARGGADLQILLGQSDEGLNRLAIGPVTFSAPAPGPGSEDDALCNVQVTSSDKVVIQDNGMVGIGAVDSTLAAPLTIRGLGDQNEQLAFEDENGQRLWQVNLGPNKNSLNIVETVPDASRLYIEAGGRVGLGTTQPLTSLHIKGDDPDLFLDINGTSAVANLTELRFGSDGAIHSSIFWSKATSKTYLHNEGRNAIVIDQEKVGIGTDNPDTKLAIQHDGGGLRLYSGRNNGHFWIGFYTDGGPGSVRAGWLGYGSDGATDLTIRNERTNGDIVLDPERNVGIDTNSPAEKLDVRGNIKLGTSGELFAPGGVENLRIVAGHVSSTGVRLHGSGFTSSQTSTGNYAINFNSNFASVPVVAACPADHSDNVASVRNLAVSSFNVRLRDVQGSGAGNDQNADFTFIAMGPR